MKDLKHTQGEWIAKQINLYTSIKPFRVYKGTKIICNLVSYDRFNKEANAKLIAAAPDLLEILKDLIKQIEYPLRSLFDNNGQMIAKPNISKAIELIKKATE